jgi:uncharacterized protein
MITVLSPAKSLDESPAPAHIEHTLPVLMKETQKLITTLKKLSAADVAKLMILSPKLAQLNFERFQAWQPKFRPGPAKQALLAFDGDVYQGFDLDAYTPQDFTYAQNHLRLLSGLHGVLRPLDLILPYRLEMGTALTTARGTSLYAFWGDLITQQLNEDLAATDSSFLVNLASQEYFAAVKPSQLQAPVLSCVFKDEKNGAYKIISFFAKRARGLMADFITRHQIKKSADLRDFTIAGYRFQPKASDDSTFVFHRSEKAREVA